jgi:hypothetical protein
MVAAIKGAARAEGFDEEQAQDTLAALIGARILRASGLSVHNTPTLGDEGGEDEP